MNILYLSKLKGSLGAGITYCIPEQIYAQSKFDNVFWLNLNHKRMNCWEKGELFHNLDTIVPRLAQLPPPFNKPDLVISQQSYNNPFSRIIWDVQKAKIPYIIIPHGEYNKCAQKEKRLKKIIGNFLWFNRMIRKSVAIEYLTENEYKNSAWPRKEHIIIPNGILLPEFQKSYYPLKEIRASFIGRLSINHKGLDILLEAVSLVKDELKSSNFSLNIFGPDENGSKNVLQRMIEKMHLQDIVSLKEGVYGEEKNKILENTDLFVLTSRYEGHPIALLEALSYGIPSLVTPGTNMDKEVFQYDAGWCAEFDATSISETLLTITKSKNEWERKSANARNLASIYSWESVAQKAHFEYEKILKEEKCV